MGVILTKLEAEQIVKRYDSNFDGHLSQSDVHELFAPSSGAMQSELLRRTMGDS